MNVIKIILLSASILAGSCSAKQTTEDFSSGYKIVEPTTSYGEETDDVSVLQLTPGKLISISNVNVTNCNRAVKAGLYIDIITSDSVITESDLSDEEIEQIFIDCGDAIVQTKANIWGMHLPYQNNDIASISEVTRQNAVSLMKRMIELSLCYFKPKHFVIHPSTGSKLTSDSNYDTYVQQSQKSLIEIQEFLDESNELYGTDAILCVENGSRTIAYDAESMLNLIGIPELEKVRICLDTGHALISLNGEDSDKNGNTNEFLKAIGKRLGTVHIQQNPGIEGQSSPYDKHLEPFTDGLIDWGEFYYDLLKTAAYRGCFMYETSYVDSYGGDTSTIETVKENYTNVILPAYRSYVASD